MKYTINGVKFSSDITFRPWDSEHRYPDFEIIDKAIFEKEANSLDEAYEWMLLNHPEYAIGCSVTSEDRRSFLLLPVKSFYLSFLPDSKQQTIVEHELKCVRQRIARDYGIKITEGEWQ